MAEKSRFTDLFGQVVVGPQHSLEVGGPGHGPEPAQVVSAQLLPVMFEEVATPKHREGVGGGDCKPVDDQAGLIIAQRKKDLDADRIIFALEWDICTEVHGAVHFVNEGSGLHLFDYPLEVSLVRCRIGELRHIVLAFWVFPLVNVRWHSTKNL